jgi:hypothetical protein
MVWKGLVTGELMVERGANDWRVGQRGRMMGFKNQRAVIWSQPLEVGMNEEDMLLVMTICELLGKSPSPHDVEATYRKAEKRLRQQPAAPNPDRD